MLLAPHLRRYGSTSLYMKRSEYEPTLMFLTALVRPGDIVLDIGANVGVYSLLLAKRLEGAGCCYSFEPGAEALVQLRRNIDLNPALKIEIVPLALSDTEGIAPLFHIGGPATFSMSGGDVQRAENVSKATLDQWAQRNAVDRVDIIKIDVEGHEPAVFRGAHSLLSMCRPLIMFEVSRGALQRAGAAIDTSWGILAALGYRMYRHEGNVLVPLNVVQEGNLFALHPKASNISRVDPYILEIG